MAHLLPSLVLHFQKYHTSNASAIKVKVQTIAHAQYPLPHDRPAVERLHALTDGGSNPELPVQPEFSQCMTE